MREADGRGGGAGRIRRKHIRIPVYMQIYTQRYIHHCQWIQMDKQIDGKM